ncbi:MAG: T9SS type A sorting domain-containing protein, partial [Ignavibacteriae bacterium]|nr:T9SS type A sorting domain-containing protein [Ignavibacteriota bacterium]
MRKIFFTLAILLTAVTITKAQWVSTGGPGGGIVNSLATTGSTIFAGTMNGGVFLTTNNGVNWSVSGVTNYIVNALAPMSGFNIYAGTSDGGVYFSYDNGGSWNPVNNGLTNLNVQALAINGVNLYAGTYNGGIFLLINNGSSWNPVNVGLTNLNVQTLASSGTNVLAGTYSGGVFITTNSGLTWNSFNNGLTNLNVRCIHVNGSNIFAGTFGSGIFLSTNSGASWITVNNGMENLYIYDITSSGQNVFAGTYSGVFLTSNNGASWVNKNLGFTPNLGIKSLLTTSEFIFAGSFQQSVWRRNLSDIIGIKQISSLIPSAYLLEQNYPNPFNPSTKIRYSLRRAGNVILRVFDALGRDIATLVNQKQSEGTYEASFDAESVQGGSLPGGVYFYRLTT